MTYYPPENLDAVHSVWDEAIDDGTMPRNLAEFEDTVIGRRIVSATMGAEVVPGATEWSARGKAGMTLTLDDGTKAVLADTDDCCAYTEVKSFLLMPEMVDHVIMGVGTTDGFTTWHVYADAGDIMKINVGWSCGNPFYYGYGFDIRVIPAVPHE